MLKFITTNEAQLSEKQDQSSIFTVAKQVLNIFNLFITFGDCFLKNPQQYDMLYYEVIRLNSIFESLNSLAEKSNIEEAVALQKSLANILAINSHFGPKITEWSKENTVVTLTEAQVYDVLKNNYQSLTLKLVDNLDVFDSVWLINGEKQELLLLAEIYSKSKNHLTKQMAS